MYFDFSFVIISYFLNGFQPIDKCVVDSENCVGIMSEIQYLRTVGNVAESISS